MTANKKLQLVLYGAAFFALVSGTWFWAQLNIDVKVGNGTVIDAVPVISSVVSRRDVPVKLSASGVVTAKQKVDVRAQTSATVKAVHIEEGQYVRKGDKLFTLDARAVKADQDKAKAQLTKTRADLANAERQLERHRELFEQGFISQAALDTMLSQVDSLRGQLGFDRAAVEAQRVARSFTEISAPINGRTGAIPVYPGSLVTQNDAALVSITQIDPILISFSLPEREFDTVQHALEEGEVPVHASVGQTIQQGRITFIDNAIDTATGTIRLKAEFPNPDNRLWPGMYVKVTLAPRILKNAFVVHTQAIQMGIEEKFLYVIEQTGDINRVTPQIIQVRLVQNGFSVIAGDNIAPGMQIVVEGAQNLKPGSIVQVASGGDEGYFVSQLENQPDQGLVRRNLITLDSETNEQ